MANRDRIRIQDLRVECVVGVWASERDVPQPLVIDLELVLDTEAAGTHEKLRETVDYHALSTQVEFVLRQSRFRLLETAAQVILKLVLAPPAPGERRARVSSATVRLTKPNALAGKGTPSIELTRDADWAVMGHEEKPFGTVDVVHETEDVGIYRLNVAPGRKIATHIHKVMQEAEMVLSDGLLCQGKPAPLYGIYRWPANLPHVYENPTARAQTILCIDSPRFIPDDEIEVTDEPGHIVPETLT